MPKKIYSIKKPKKTYLQKIRTIVGSGNKKIAFRQMPKSEYDLAGRFSLVKGTEPIAAFHLQQLPGCCGVCISHSTYIKPTYRNKGLGKLLNRMKQQLAWDDGYTLMLCTDVNDNQPQQKIFKKTGWEEVSSFRNRRTQNKVGVQARVLRPTGCKIGAENEDGKKFRIVRM